MTYRRYQSRQHATTKTPARWRAVILISLLLCSSLTAAIGAVPATAEVPAAASLQAGDLLINEVKSGDTVADEAVIDEYVSLYNATDQPIGLSDIHIEYAKAAFPAAACNSVSWKQASSKNVNSLALSGDLPARSISPPFELAINNSGAGAVRIVGSNGQTVDLLGWGSDSAPAPCAEAVQSPMLAVDKSLQRYAGCGLQLPIDTDVNADDFVLGSQPTPGTSHFITAPQCQVPELPPATSEPIEPQPTAPPESPAETPQVPLPNEPVDSSACLSVAISELLPNPAGSDGGHEFIELHNTGATSASLAGCRLEIANDSFSFTDQVLQAGEYRAFSDTETGITLPNASGGTVWLANPTHDLQIISYPGELEDDQSWSLADGGWHASYSPTPNGSNLLTASKPCPADQIRNVETNRCISIATAEASQSGAATTATVLAACAAGQERNPETNRCRSVASATTAKDCPAGQERNPETNRCRKLAAAATSGNNTIQDAETAPAAHNKPYWLIAALLLVAAAGYAVYEWRQELRLFWQRRFGRSAATSAATQS